MKPIIIAAMAAILASSIGSASAEPIELQWWHAMTSVNAEVVNKIASDFNAAQTAYKVTPVFKGSYAETMTAAIAAFRAGNPPHIVQVFEVGTATMMTAKGAVKPVYQLMADAGEPFDPQNYLPAVTGYYSTADGKMLSMPFNSSTAIVYWNKDAFTKAGLDAEKPPKTWPEVGAAAKRLRAAGAACGLTTSWPSWINASPPSPTPDPRATRRSDSSGSTRTASIMPLSSWARMWQWNTYLPRIGVTRNRITTLPPGLTSRPMVRTKCGHDRCPTASIISGMPSIRLFPWSRSSRSATSFM